MKITFIYRKKHPAFFSIEKVFGVLMHELRQVEVNTIELPLTSGGLLSIFINLIYLKWKTRNKQHDIFHITGDVHYAILSVPANRTILGIHDLVFLDTHKGIRRWFLKWIYLDIPVQKALFINTISEKSKQEIILFFIRC